MIFALAVTGPTASGKTAVSIELAKRLSGEIISCDSMQIYKEMNIGTAKPTERERGEAPHHLVDFLSPEESFSVERYREMALCTAKDICSRGKLPIFAGGTGLYIDSIMRNSASESPESDPEYRERILSTVKDENDALLLWEKLRSVDAESAEKIHHNNVKRVIRALEIYEKTGKSKSELDRESRLVNSEISVGIITIDFHDRENLYRRADSRVDAMIEEGLADEVVSLYKRGILDNGTASQAIGYKELLTYVRGEKTLPEAVEDLKLATRRYAKRQLTWFRRYSDALRLYPDTEEGEMKSTEKIIGEALELAEKLIQENKQQI